MTDRNKWVERGTTTADTVASDESKADAPLLSSFVGVALSPNLVFDKECTYELAFLPLHTGCAVVHFKRDTGPNIATAQSNH